MAHEIIPLFGATCACDRCGERLRVAADRNPDARMLRHAAEPRGLCATCALRVWFYEHRDTFRDLKPEDLRHVHIQVQTGQVMKAMEADVGPEEINWDKLIAGWDLPLKTQRRS